MTHLLFCTAWRHDCDTTTNSNNLLSLQRELEELKIPFIVVEGCYEGRTEPSFAVDVTTLTATAIIRIIRKVCREYTQDCVAYMNGSTISFYDGYANLISAPAKVVVSDTPPSGSQDYTKFPAVWYLEETIHPPFSPYIGKFLYVETGEK